MSSPVASLLPPASTPLERALEAATARLGAVDVPIRPIANPLTCPASVLPFLAWAYSVDEWSPKWSLETKRAVVASAIANHGLKGTVAALRAGLEALGYSPARIVEWFQAGGDGEPYTFRLELTASDDVDLGPDGSATLAAVVSTLKNLRSHLTGLAVARDSRAPLRPVVGVIARHATTTQPGPA